MKYHTAGRFWILGALIAVAVWPCAVLAQAPSTLHVITPQNSPTIHTDFIDIRYELIDPSVSAASPPNFALQLGTESAVQTNSTDYTFTGLQPGHHTVLIKLVDPKGAPISGSTSAVSFTVVPQPAPRGASTKTQIPVESASAASAPDPLASEHERQSTLPENNGALPLLSLIGFGVLVGGIVSALKTR